MWPMPTLAPTPLVIAGVPSNIRLPEGSRGTHISSDLFDISARLREIDTALFIILLEHVNGQAVWAVCETDRAGVESLVFRVGPGCEIDELDQRVVDKINYIRRVPANERMRLLQRDLDREADAKRDDERERMYEQMGSTLYDNLFKCGFVMTPKPESRTPQNATARRAGRRLA